MSKLIFNKIYIFILAIAYLVSIKFTILLLILSLLLIFLCLFNDWSLIRRFIITLITFFALNNLTAFIFFFLHIPLEPIYIGTLYVFFTSLYLFFIKKKLFINKIITKNDLLYLIIPISIFVVFFIGISHYDNGKRIPIMTGWDGAAHFTMVRTAVEQKKLLYGESFYDGTPTGGDWAYPPGFYTNTAITYLFISSNFPYHNITYLSNYYYVFSFLLVGVLIYIIGLLIDNYIDDSAEFISKLIVIPFLFLFIFGFIALPLFYFDFFPQILAFIFLITLILVLEKSKKYSRTTQSIYIILLNFAISSSWWVLMPVSLALCAYYLFNNFGKRNCLILSIGTIISLIPIYLSIRGITVGNSGSLVDAFNAVAGVSVGELSTQILFVLFIIALGYIYFDRKNNNNIYLLFAVIFSSLYSFLVFSLQIITSGQVGYFLYKILYFLALVLGLIACIFLIKASSTILKYIKIYTNRIFFICIICFCLSMFLYFLSGQQIVNYVIGYHPVSSFKQNTMIYLSNDRTYSNYEIIPFTNDALTLLWSQAYFSNISRFYHSEDAWNSVQFNQNKAIKLLTSYIMNHKGRKILIVDFDCSFKNHKIKGVNSILDLNKKGIIDIYPIQCSAFSNIKQNI